MKTISILLSVLAGLILLLIALGLTKKKQKDALIAKKQETEQHLKIAEENYFKRKITKTVFEKISSAYKKQILEIEMELLPPKNSQKQKIKQKTEEVLNNATKMTRFDKHKIEKIITKIEKLNQELDFLQSKFMKREIDENMLNQLTEEKHKEIIKKEAKLRQILKK